MSYSQSKNDSDSPSFSLLAWVIVILLSGLSFWWYFNLWCLADLGYWKSTGIAALFVSWSYLFRESAPQKIMATLLSFVFLVSLLYQGLIWMGIAEPGALAFLVQ